MQSIKAEKNTQKDVNHTEGIFTLNAPVVCTNCGGRMHRRFDRRRKATTWWQCPECKASVNISDEDMLNGINNNQFINNLKAPTVQVGAFADIYSVGSAAGRCHSIRPLSFKSNSTSVPLAFFITTLSSIFSLNESFISVIGFLSIA